MMELKTIARPYAEAIFYIAIQKNTIEEWKKILILINEISSNEKIKHFLSGALSPKYLASVFISISKDLINKEAENFIRLLAQNQRLNILKNILNEFLNLEALHKNIIYVELTSSFHLENTQIIQIKNTLEKILLKKIKFIYKIDQYILSGIILKINDTVLDFSMRNDLEKMSHILKY
ncbi:F0F1 ATP synthase subunit delta [Buchnera aphidicola (Muscaphis stroyani)]|uniref:ATP synthase subunit delta n=1 Tax=Buchnera aphidicola (Muscaphis stroyani) TaxID=1241869 RepID=A0A4D6YE20_9GAMM|nr:F0F1 ATP synthase subunit delta [Buchnera aphidicola]QCI24128.1 F0F1 ATP synthase subunit delta [Buchnera aphidicola (Muscaphis stroyani)]